MHTEVKIGLAVGLGLLVGIVAYFSLVGKPVDPPSATTPGPLDQADKDASRVELIGEVAPAEPPKPDPVEVAPVTTAPPAATDVPPVTTDAPAPPSGLIVADTPVDTPDAPVAPRQQSRIYLVTEGDTGGFWVISQKMYGDGKYHQLIAAANPTADPHRLRPGQRLVIPSLDRPSAPASTTSPALPSGASRIYVVQKGDSGFWGVAQKVYGKGTEWPRIQRANPTVDPLKLQPGQKLVIPPLSESLVGGGERVVTVTPEPGKGTYTVTAADHEGFWGIAKKVYGDGKYYQLLIDANPTIDPQNLRAGQVLVTPDRSELLKRPTATGTRTPRASTQPSSTAGKPYFE